LKREFQLNKLPNYSFIVFYLFYFSLETHVHLQTTPFEFQSEVKTAPKTHANFPNQPKQPAINRPTFRGAMPEINNKQKQKLAISFWALFCFQIAHHVVAPLAMELQGGALLLSVLDFALPENEIVNFYWMCW